jgi:hypothetical protein
MRKEALAMQLYPIRSDRVSLAVTETGGQLSDVVFSLDGGRQVMPLHTAPWVDEPLGDDIPEIIRVLRGDFFCAPFGASDVIPGETRVHGLPGSGRWRLTGSTGASLDAVLDGTVLGATLTKRVELRPGEAIVYQRHVFTGGNGRLPYGHHAMLRAEKPLRIAFSPRLAALTPPEPIEEPPHGYPLLAEGQSIADLTRARRPDGSLVDLTVFPSVAGTEALWTVVTKPDIPLGWTAATSDDDWVWFGLKNPRTLPETLIWFSHGGRRYPPWNGRHTNAIGLEEICAYFHLGHRISAGHNPIAAMGVPTAAELRPDRAFSVSYLFGVAPVAAGFGAVTDIAATAGGVTITGASGKTVFAACDTAYLAG